MMRPFMNVTKALADETRVRTLLALGQGELCVCQITELFHLAPSTMSKHLSVLTQAGLVNSRKNGRWIYYSVPGREASPAVREALRWIRQSLSDNPVVAADARQLAKVLKTNPTDLCKRQCKS